MGFPCLSVVVLSGSSSGSYFYWLAVPGYGILVVDFQSSWVVSVETGRHLKVFSPIQGWLANQ